MQLGERLAALANEAELPPEVRALVEAADVGPNELAAALAGESAPEGTAPFASASSAAGSPTWLSSITVEGFRGIGPQAELLLDPGPGLTLVVGRNGSGKSSFAEGLEALLTGSNLRWHDRPKAWQEGWRNLHSADRTRVAAEFQREGDTTSTAVERQFGDAFDESTVAFEAAGSSLAFEDLGWGEALSSYKPFLSYNELGSMLEQKPSAIYDSMASVLGLERVTEARERLRTARLDLEKEPKEVAKSKKELREILGAADDDRAAGVDAMLSKRSVDLDALFALVAATSVEGEGDLPALARVEPPDPSACEQAAAVLEEAVAHRSSFAGTDASRDKRVSELLRAALAHRNAEGDNECPVCGGSLLDEAWALEAEQNATRLEVAAADVEAADRAVVAARQQALRLVSRPNAVLESATVSNEAVEAAMSRAASAWNDWATAPDEGWDEASLSSRLKDVGSVVSAVDEVRTAAAEALKAADADWRPLAARVTAWVESARNAERADQMAKRCKVAEDFYKEAEATLREERFAPIAEQASDLWAGLRQRSNVSLDRVALEGSTTQRRVELDVTVDGTETSALGVMSQGELHALALALFLPRVTSDESPFRFVLIDDPVQAMDPARVDGLAQVLHEVAQTRQVVVFTHDDRLPSACRRLQLSADVIEVDRRQGSRVSTRPVASPSRAAIDDAFALAKTEKLPPDLQRRIVPVHCRRAVEAAARDQVWRRFLGEGKAHHEIDQAIEDAGKTTDLLGLLFFGEVAATSEVYDALRAIEPSLAGKLGFLNKAVHEPPADLKPTLLVSDTRKLVSAIEDYRP